MVHLLALRSKIFARLLRYRPTPQDLVQWMKNMGEIDRRIAGTELEAMIPKGAAGQRAAVQGTFNQAAAAFQLLPKQEKRQGPVDRSGMRAVTIPITWPRLDP